MKTELQAQKDYLEIENLIKSLQLKMSFLQYDRITVSMSGNNVKVQLIEMPRYKTITHTFRNGKYERLVE